MQINTKIAIIFLIVLSVGVYMYIQSVAEKNVAEIESSSSAIVPQEQGTDEGVSGEGESSSPVELQWTVTAVNPEKLEIVVTKDAVEKTVKINPATRIEKIISQKNADGVVENQASEEMNIGDLRKGDLVTIDFQSEKDNVLDQVKAITFTVNGNIEEYQKQFSKSQEENPMGYIRGKVVAIDIAGKLLEYKISYIDGPTTTMSIAIPDGIPVYQVDDPARMMITHTRKESAISEVRPGQTIFFAVDSKSLSAGTFAPKVLIISDK